MTTKTSSFKLLILLFTLFNYSGYGQDWLKDTCDLNGPVHFVEYESKCGGIESEHTYEYNRQGFLVNWDETWFGFLGGHNGKYRVFDESGTRCLKESRAYNNEISQLYEMYYNENGQLEKQTLHDDGVHWSTFNYRYNESGKLVEEFIVIQSDMDTIHHYFEYDSEGRITKDSYIEKKRKKITAWKYDDNGILLEETFWDTNWIAVAYNEPDENQIVLKEEDYNGEPNTSGSYHTTFEYNEKGQIIREQVTNIEQTDHWETIKTYDKNGFLITMQASNITEGGGLNVSYHYKFDRQGNWIKKTTKVNGKSQQKEKRSITYY